MQILILGTNGTQQVRGKSPRKLTQPKTPQLQTRSRSRPVTVLSKHEQEEKEAEEIDRFVNRCKIKRIRLDPR